MLFASSLYALPPKPGVATDADGHGRLFRRSSLVRNSSGGLLTTSNFPLTGEPHSLVVLVDFPDKAFSMENPNGYFDRMLNSPDFTDNGATGSVRSYFTSNSCGLFNPVFDVVGPITLPHDVKYYGANVFVEKDGAVYISDAHPEQLVIHACTILDADGFDFSVYDYNGDDEIDNIYLFYAGYGEADGGDANTVWPHALNILDVETDQPYIFDGLYLNHYACSNELRFPGKTPDGIGTFVHEFSHVMGLPDLYSTLSTVSGTPGDWDVMDVGCYLNSSRTPPNYSSFELMALGWLDPEELTVDADYSLSPLHGDDGKAYIVHAASPDEFYLFECRQQVGADSFLPGHGMLVWHIVYDEERWTSNTVNSFSDYKSVKLVEADNLPGHYEILEGPNSRPELVYVKANEGDPFPGTTGATSFTATGTPAFCDIAGKALGIDIIDIAESKSGVISFRTIENGVSGVSNTLKINDKVMIQNNCVQLCEGSGTIYNYSGLKIADISTQALRLDAGFYIVAVGGQYIKIAIR